MADLLIFPWLGSRDPQRKNPIVIGDWELYSIDNMTIGDVPKAVQDAVRRLMGHYRTPQGDPIRFCTLAKYRELPWLDPIPEDLRWQGLQEAVCLAGLAKRRFFSEVAGYPTSHDFDALRWVNIDHGNGFGFSNRRKDGSSVGWASENAPRGLPYPGLHYLGYRFEIDQAQADACLRAMMDGNQDRGDFEEALVHFRLANYDAPTTPPHIELQLIKGAFERLTGADRGGNPAKKFVEAMQGLRQCTGNQGPPLDHPRLRLTPPDYCQGLFGAWAWDFHQSRGDLAHGRRETLEPRWWDIEEHVRLGCFLFPKLVRVWLFRNGFLSEEDSHRQDLVTFDKLLDMQDHFARTEDDRFLWENTVSDGERERTWGALGARMIDDMKRL